MNRRINIVLPETTIKTIDRMSKPGHRSGFIDTAVLHFIANRSADALRARLERAVVRDRDLDREVSADWSSVDKESWLNLDKPEQQNPATRRVAKSTSPRSTRR